MEFSLACGHLESTLDFGGSKRSDPILNTISVSASRARRAGWSTRLGAGVLLDGTISSDGQADHAFRHGGLVAAGVERQLRPGRGVWPAVHMTLQGGLIWGLIWGLTSDLTWARTRAPNRQEDASYFARDLRLGARATWPLPQGAYPSLAARAFEGPVQWDRMGNRLVVPLKLFLAWFNIMGGTHFVDLFRFGLIYA